MRKGYLPEFLVLVLVLSCFTQLAPRFALPVHWPGFLSTLNHSMETYSDLPTLLLGDFTFPTINWTTNHTTQTEISASHEFIEFMQYHNLSQHVTLPTRHRHGQISSLLDLVISSPDIQMSPILHHAPLGRSDHDLLECDIDMDFQLNFPETVRRNFRKAMYF